jgi:hypothetical protein
MNLTDLPKLINSLNGVKADLENVLYDVSPEWLLRGATAKLISFVLETAKRAGPPEGFAERFSLTADQAQALYDAVLTDALRRPKSLREVENG